MPQANPFLAPGAWYKGALHVHTTASDGKLTPAQSIELHRTHDYHFMSITDHRAITNVAGLDAGGLLMIPGVEGNFGQNELGQSYHIVLLGARAWQQPPAGYTIQQAIDLWAGSAELRFLAHPYWSGMVAANMMPLERLDGVEIYNTASTTDLGKGLSTVHWDDVLVRGKRWWGYAVDDTHGTNDDAMGGWVCVKSERLDERSIIAALKGGAFYSSSGPEILDFRLVDGVASLRCSPVVAINFIGHTQWGLQRHAAPGQAITEAEYRLNGRERYLRAECVDGAGHAAWTNPIFIG